MAKRALFIDGRKVFKDGRAVTVTVGSEGDCECCGGEETCVIESDNFNRADSSDLNAGAPFTWGGDTTDTLISSNELVLISGTTQRLSCPTGHSSSSGIVSAKFRADTSDECEVWLNGTDVDNCLVARVTVGTSETLEIIERVGGSDTVLESVTATTASFDQFIITLYYDAATGTAKAVTATNDVCAFLIDVVGTKYGVGIGANAGLVYIDDFTFTQIGDGENGCPEMEGCGYDSCSIYPIPSGWESVVSLSGASDGSCSGCDTELNTAFIVPFVSSSSSQTLFTLEYESDTICAPLTDTLIRVIVNVWCSDVVIDSPSPTQYGIRVFLQVNRSTTSTWAWYKNLGTTPPDLHSTYTGFTQYFTNNSGGWCSVPGSIAVDSVSFNPP